MTDRELEFRRMREELVDPDFGDDIRVFNFGNEFWTTKAMLRDYARVLPADGTADGAAGNPADSEVQQVRPLGNVFLPEDDPDGEW